VSTLSVLSDRDRWLPGGPPDPADFALYLLPPAGGSASIYRLEEWTRGGDGVRVAPVELPGHGRRLAEPPVSDLSELVDRLDAACRPAAGRWAVLGHSMGALVAQAWAAKAARQGRAAKVLYLSAAAPAWRFPIAADLLGCDDTRLWERFVGFGAVLDRVQTSAAVARLITRVIRADLTAVAALCGQPPEPAGCPVVAFHGTEDTAFPHELLDGWREIADGGFTRISLPGAHFYERGLGQLAGSVHADLADRGIHCQPDDARRPT
jgi:medium-chain acyl-[acyl-carrier-protein] hydrolase